MMLIGMYGGARGAVMADGLAAVRSASSDDWYWKDSGWKMRVGEL